jgi:hypothetical protein
MFTKRLNAVLLLAVTFLTLFIVTACETAQETIPTPEMEGTWIGIGKVMISNEYLNQRELAFMVEIAHNGNVTGYCGDATLLKTRLQKPAWFLGLIGKKKYSATFKLGGAIASRESFSREGGTITFDGVKDGEMLAHFVSTGSQVNSENLTLEVRDIRMAHPGQQ